MSDERTVERVMEMAYALCGARRGYGLAARSGDDGETAEARAALDAARAALEAEVRRLVAIEAAAQTIVRSLASARTIAGDWICCETADFDVLAAVLARPEGGTG